MISTYLAFFGATLAYTGFLVLGRDTAAGLAILAVGVVLLIRPLLEAFHHIRGLSGFGLKNQAVGARRRKPHLTVVRSEEEKPTIH